MKRYPDTLLRLLTDKGFDEAFESEINNHKTYESAYEAVEAELIKWLSYRKYANYDSYRVCRNLRLKNRSDGDNNLNKRI